MVKAACKGIYKRTIEKAKRARDELLKELKKLERYESHLDAPKSVPGVYLIWSKSTIVYVGSTGHGKSAGLRERLYRTLKRTGLSPLRKGIAKEIGYPEYQPKSRGPRDPEIDKEIDAKVQNLKLSYMEAKNGKEAMKLERLIRTLLEPKYNKV